jgi:4-amino-4-deoxy-L-arabinose transferase-like glycosyltransferase
LSAAGFVAFLPMQVALSGSVTNDIAAEALVAAGLWQIVVAMRAGWSWRRIVTVGASCGLAVLMKSSGIVLLPVAWLALLLGGGESGRSSTPARTGARLAALTAAALLICGWWLARNWRLYGDPLATRAFVEAFASTRPTPESIMARYHLSGISYAIWVIRWTFASFWGVFGNMRIFMPTWGVYVPLLAVSLAAAGGLVRELREARAWEAGRRAIWPLALAVILVLAAFALFNVSFFQAQGRYLFQALPVMALALVAGWGRLFPAPARDVGYTVLWLALMALSALALPVWVLPAMASAG